MGDKMRVSLLAMLVGVSLLLVGCARKKSTADLVAQLKAPDSAQRLRAANALGQRKSEAAVVVSPLAEALADNDAFVRREAANSLGKIGPDASEAVPKLIVAAKDPQPKVRQAALDALMNIDPAAADRASAKDRK
jgi:HEAT repeat protein